MKLILLALLTTTAHAHVNQTVIQQVGHHNVAIVNQRIFIREERTCVYEYETLLSESTRVSRSCSTDGEPELTMIAFNYPLMPQMSGEVQAWTGAATREVTTTHHYLRELVDVCHGRTLSAQRYSNDDTETQSFEIANPNLNARLRESFMTSPMTEAQAKRAQATALARCKQKR